MSAISLSGAASALTLSGSPDPFLPMKRALIVDDSRSARVILGRMLEGYAMAVDSSESAEQALEYLKDARPDVIFMDHLMPGMDGFQAVAAIKGNPETATIPVVMYTSQEGELYVSQARALGAVAVLPKTVKQSDVSRVLYQLRLLPERRDMQAHALAHAVGQRSAQPRLDSSVVQIESPPRTPGEVETAIRSVIGPALNEQTAEMRRFVLASLETFARRISAETKTAGADATAEPALEALPAPPPSRWPLAAALAALALAPTIILGVLYLQTLESGKALTESNARLAAVIQEQQAQLAAIQQSLDARDSTLAAMNAPLAAPMETETVPYGETPLGGARLERLRRMIDNLKAANFHGRISIATHVGAFCLAGNGVEGYSMAADDLPARRCDLIGNPFEDSLAPAQRQSLAFANLLSALRQEVGDSLSVDVQHHGGELPQAPYPSEQQLARTSAGEWNKIAAQNNRVEFVAEASGS
jgi:CheY-like chemotaxis protein